MFESGLETHVHKGHQSKVLMGRILNILLLMVYCHGAALSEIGCRV